MRFARFALPGLVYCLSAAPLLADQHYANQHYSNAVARQLRAGGQLRGYRIDVAYHNGTAELTGVVADAGQRDEAVRLAQSVPGVTRVVSRLQTNNPMRLTPADFQAQDETAPPPRRVATPVSEHPAPAAPQDPVPSFRAAPPGYMVESLPPPMPPHAWPTYAPYNNFSRVAYPTSYPYEAFPHIGPVYPFPKAPLGWRSVKLEFSDGFWYMSNHAQQRDWWSLRYW